MELFEKKTLCNKLTRVLLPEVLKYQWSSLSACSAKPVKVMVSSQTNSLRALSSSYILLCSTFPTVHPSFTLASFTPSLHLFLGLDPESNFRYLFRSRFVYSFCFVLIIFKISFNSVPYLHYLCTSVLQKTTITTTTTNFFQVIKHFFLQEI